MSAASVVSPITTTYIQSPSRFIPQKGQTATRRQEVGVGAQTGGPAPASYYRHQSKFGVTEFEGRPPRVVDTQAHPISLDSLENPYTAQAQALSGTRRLAPTTTARFTKKGGPRVNPNSRTSAGFPLAVTAQQAAENAARKKQAKEEWEREQQELFERATQEAIREEEAKAEEKRQQDAIFFQTQNLSPNSRSNSRAQQQPAELTQKQKQQQLHARQLRDSKISFRDRIVPPKPDFEEDPLTAQASEHTGIYPGPLHKAPAFQPTGEIDDEPAAPEGTKERELQKLRANPLLDPTFQGKSDAAGLGYGRKHPTHFRYISHWTVPDTMYKMSYELSQNSKAMAGYRSKSGLGYREEVRGLGWGHEHDAYNSVVSVRRKEDVLKDYPDGLHCLKLYNYKQTV